MTDWQLKEYLGMIVDMEQNIYLQNQLIQQLRQKINGLGQAQHFEKPIEPPPYQKHMYASIIQNAILMLAGLWIFI